MPTMFMETTQVSDVNTVAEIQHLLACRGAKSVVVEYDTGGGVAGVAFQYRVGDRDIGFRLPCRWKSVEALLKRKNRRSTGRNTLEAKSRRIAWRQILRWVQAQLALIETGMVKTQEVFLPYMIVNDGEGGPAMMFEVVEKRQYLLKESPVDVDRTGED